MWRILGWYSCLSKIIMNGNGLVWWLRVATGREANLRWLWNLVRWRPVLMDGRHRVCVEVTGVGGRVGPLAGILSAGVLRVVSGVPVSFETVQQTNYFLSVQVSCIARWRPNGCLRGEFQCRSSTATITIMSFWRREITVNARQTRHISRSQSTDPTHEVNLTVTLLGFQDLQDQQISKTPNQFQIWMLMFQ